MLRFSLVLLLSLGACAPWIVPPGPVIGEPHLTDTHAVMADGARLPLHTWGPEVQPKAAIIALHGFNDYGAFFAMPGPFFARAGVRVYAYDQRGFGKAPHWGLWPGADAFVEDLKTVTALVRARHPDTPLFLFGDSMGGAVVMVAMASWDDPPFDGTVLAAPAVWGRTTMPFYQRAALWFSAHTIPWLTVSGRGLNITPSDNEDMLIALGKDPLVIKDTRIDTVYGLVNLMDKALAVSAVMPEKPALILYGQRDEIIPHEPTARMLQSIAQKPGRKPSIGLYPDGYHMLIRDLSAETVWRDIVAWISAPGAPLPSGAAKTPAQAARALSRDQ